MISFSYFNAFGWGIIGDFECLIKSNVKVITIILYVDEKFIYL